MKRADTIALYKEQYLSGRDEIDRRKFEEKDEQRQYSAIMAWRNRRKAAEQRSDAAEATPASVAEMLKSAKRAVESFDELSDKDSERLIAALNELKTEITDFDLIRKTRKLKQLRAQRQDLDREIERLESEGVKEC